MKKTFIDDTLRTFDRAADYYKRSNPLCTHKSFTMKDEYYRKDRPNDDLLTVEFGMDSENYVLVIAAVAVGVIILCKAVSCMKKSAEKRRIKQHYCRHR